MLAKIGHVIPPFALCDQHGQNATPLEDDVMGDPVVLVFDRNSPDAAPAESARLLQDFGALHERLDGLTVTLFVLSQRSAADNAALARDQRFPFQLLSDEDKAVFDAYGIETTTAPAPPVSIVVDPNGRAVQVYQQQDLMEQVNQIVACLREMDAQRARGSLGAHPPVNVIPNAMDAEMCGRLIETWHNPVPLWEGDGQTSTGFNVETGDFKVSNARYGNVVQYIVRDAALMGDLDRTVMGRIIPQMEKAFGYRPKDREEYRIACYDVAEEGSLPAHRDNPTESTKHRRFTVSVNLNNRSYEGGELTFRESSDHRYDVPEGTAIVWSCSLLHEILPVTAGRRFILGTHLYG
jgi:peroxiredoxin